jgi:hypothetical protein
MQGVNFGLGPGLVNMIIGVPGGDGRSSFNFIEGEGFACDT